MIIIPFFIYNTFSTSLNKILLFEVITSFISSSNNDWQKFEVEEENPNNKLYHIHNNIIYMKKKKKINILNIIII